MTIETDTRLLTAATAAAPGWRDFALCRVTDPEAFFPRQAKTGAPRNGCARAAKFARPA